MRAKTLMRVAATVVAASAGLAGLVNVPSNAATTTAVAKAQPAPTLAAGRNHTCALNAAGTLKCWGANWDGQVGDRSTTDRRTPVAVYGLATGVVAVTAGYAHTCALTSAGGVKCWGLNSSGQLGAGIADYRSTSPVDVLGLTSGVVAVAAGWWHTCAVTSAGAVKCWGDNGGGQLGDRTTTNSNAPVDAWEFATGAAGVAGGMHHSCAVLAAGGVKCWGFNDMGQLGDGSTNFSLQPVDVQAIGDGVAVSAGSKHSCVRTVAGATKCWGYNANGELGDTTTTDRLAPADTFGLAGITAGLATHDSHGCALILAGGVKCWGLGPPGQLGDGTGSTRTSPVDVTGLDSGASAVAVGGLHSCARLATGGVKCWGFNSGGQLGNGTTTTTSLPATVTGLDPVLHALTVSRTGTGTGAVTSDVGGVACGDTCTVSLVADTLVVLTATPAPGSTFTGWGGACSGNATCEVVMAAASSVTAHFRTCDMGDAADCDGDGIANAVELAEGRNPLVMDNDIFASDRLFAMQQYRDFLSREGDVAGITGWTDLVAAGTYTRAQVIDAFLRSDEFGGVIAPVVRLYFATFLRVPDYAGMTYNAGLVRNGTISTLQLAEFFTASPEFAARYGALDNAAFVTLLYNNVLGRAPDPAGPDGWLALMASGMTRGQVLLGFSDSPEYSAAMANEVLVTMMYAGMLRRTPETVGFAGWVGALDAGSWTREQVIQGFLGSAEYRARSLPVGMPVNG